jgi:predicted dehydrogenase
MSNHEVRAGVIGTGFIGPVHMEALRRLGVRIAAICDTTDRAKAAAEQWGIPEAYGDLQYEKLIASPNVDVVHITSPNRFHCEMALAALKAGKHCICEKPLAMNTKETARIVKTAAAAKTVFAVNYNIRFYPAILQLKKMVERGELGDIIHVNGSYMQDWLFKDTDYNWRLLPQEGGSLRAVADIGTHWMDTVSYILGSKIQWVFTDQETFHKQRKRPLGEVQTFSKAGADMQYASYKVQTEDFGFVLLKFENEARANLSVSQVAAGRKNCIRIEIYGSRKSAWWNSESPNTLEFGNRDSANQVAIRNTPGFSEDIAGFTDYPGGHNEGFPDTFKMLFRCIYQNIASGDKGPQLYATAADGHQEVKVCEAILKSHQKKSWQKV